ncbi:MAG: DUF2721 domain-containing protein [Arcobacter sp.]|mgnify:CR=1 FL=1|nr:MAG: DUF2721 domain-containing protein [Arcobacter sp.]
MLTSNPNDIINTISSLIQISVAPVFLLAGVAGLLNVFTSRLTRIIDKVEKLDNYVNSKEKKDSNYKEDERIIKRRTFLIMRMQNTNLAIFYCTATGLMIALVILTMFLSELLNFHSSTFISILFIMAMASLIIALLLFLREIYFTTSFIKSKKSTFKSQK